MPDELPAGQAVPFERAFALALERTGIATPEQAVAFLAAWDDVIAHNDEVLRGTPVAWPWRRNRA